MFRTFLAKLTLASVALALIATVLLGWAVLRAARGELVEEMRSGLRGQLLALAPEVPERGVDAWADAAGARLATRVTVIAPDGGVLGDSEVPAARLAGLENHAERPEVAAAARAGFGSATRHSDTVDEDFLYAALRLDSGRTLRLALPLFQVRQRLRRLRQAVLGSSVLAFVAAVLISLVATRWVHRPVRALAERAERIARGELAGRVAVPEEEELGRLAEAMNALIERVGSTVRQVSSEKANLQALLANMVEGVALVDAEGIVLEVNAAMRGLFGVEPGAARGKKLLTVFRHAQLQDLLAEAVAARGPRLAEMTLFTPDERHFEAHANPILEGDEVRGVVLVLHDITRLRGLESLRRDFVANVSHELRTPLASIRGFSETLLRGALEDAKHRKGFVQKIEKASVRLGRLVEDLLDLSSIESGRRPAHKERLDLRAAIDEALGILGPIAEDRKVMLKPVVEPGLEVHADPSQLQQVLQNLIDNAIKFNQPGGEVRVRAERADGTVRIEVSDDGLGIPEKHLPRLFERFYRVDKARSLELGGTGLGLSIVKHIVEAHGGTIQARSPAGEGATFTVTFPS